MDKVMVKIENLTKEYPIGDEVVVALKNINLNIKQGEICCILGPSGSGKSTLLNQMAGMEKPTEGDVFIKGVPISRLREDELAAFRQDEIGFIFQSYNLIPSINTVDNVAMPLMFKGIDKEIRDIAAINMLKKVGLGTRLAPYPSQLSGGQPQSIGIARAFVAHPSVVFADEPTGNLDTKNTDEIMEMITEFARKYNMTIILVTHNPLIADLADRIITLKDGEIIGDLQKANNNKERKM